MDPINEAYELSKNEMGQMDGFEKIIRDLLENASLEEFAQIGKIIGGRIKEVVEETHKLAPEDKIKEFKEGVTKGLK